MTSIHESDQFRVPLLAEETILAMEQDAQAERWPKKQLLQLALKLSRAERQVHVAQVGGDTKAAVVAMLARVEAHAHLREEQGAVANVLLSSLSHAMQYKPVELAELIATLFSTPAVKAAVVPVLAELLKPTLEWLKGEQQDAADRVADLEAAVAAEGAVYS